MKQHRPQTPFQAMRRPRFLISAWPWRCLAHVATTVVVALSALFPLTVLSAPLVILVVAAFEAVTTGNRDMVELGTLIIPLMLLGAVLLATAGPLVTMPLAALERFRLRLLDDRPAVSGRRPLTEPGLWAWVRTRYTEPATWYGFAYAALLILVMLPLIGVFAGFLAVSAVMLLSPFILLRGVEVISLGDRQLTEPIEAIPYQVAGSVLVLFAAPYLLGAIAGFHGMIARALLNRRHERDLSVELIQVSRSRARLVDAFEAERRRIERDLHDGAQQRLVALSMQLGLARLDIPADSPAAEPVERAQEQAKLLLAELRELIQGIHPKVLSDRGLDAALPELADRSPVPVRLLVDVGRRLPAHIEGTAYFVAAEALTNVAKHSKAAQARLSATLEEGVLVLEITDDGVGGAVPAHGSGLTGLADRVAVMDGVMTLSSPMGGPTLIRVELPCP